jgi:nucleotide-binding universal stress UspA family protein
MKVLLPVDGSDYTRRMMKYLADHRELLGPDHDYIIFTAVARIPPDAARFLAREAVETHYREQADLVLQPASRFAAEQGWRARVKHAAGNAVDAISAIVQKEGPDLIVMGSHGHSALGNVVLGSVSNGVINRCKPPVLLIR